ncbi:hypothetical protein TNCV_2117231 [Trichonephila clavipes]|nr:hypothetical protein TNCV_2117231 [Trichonephila clavipes]
MVIAVNGISLIRQIFDKDILSCPITLSSCSAVTLDPLIEALCGYDSLIPTNIVKWLHSSDRIVKRPLNFASLFPPLKLHIHSSSAHTVSESISEALIQFMCVYETTFTWKLYLSIGTLGYPLFYTQVECSVERH